MYQEFFQFKEFPFSLTPDTDFFINQQSHKEILMTTMAALRQCEGFVKVVGEVGTGKTLLSRVLMSKLDDEFVTAYIPNPYLGPNDLKYFLAQEISAHCTKKMRSYELLESIYQRLIAIAEDKKKVVLIIDEAQAMPRETIECVRLLTNLETRKRKLLQVVMLGQPELDVVLDRADLRQLKQRIVFSEYLKPLNFSGVVDYIHFRLSKAAIERIPDVSKTALFYIYISSGGIPRLLNILSHKAFICAFGRGDKNICLWHAAKAVLDTGEAKRLASLCSPILALSFFAPRSMRFA